MNGHIDENDLIHCIYSSAETVEFSHEDIISLLARAREMNTKLGVTGMLLYEAGTFFQVLEGPAQIVADLYKKIGNDKRHDRVIKIIQEPIKARSFSEWTMGYSDVTREELKEIQGLNDFFHSQKCYTELDEGREKKYLQPSKKVNGEHHCSKRGNKTLNNIFLRSHCSCGVDAGEKHVDKFSGKINTCGAKKSRNIFS